MAREELEYDVELNKIYKKYESEIAEKEKGENCIGLDEAVDMGVRLQEEMWELNIKFKLWNTSKGYDHVAIYYVSEFLNKNSNIQFKSQLKNLNPDGKINALAEMLFDAIDIKNKKRIHVIEPYPGDMLASASGICYSPGISLVLQTMCSVKDGRNFGNLNGEECGKYKSIQKKPNVDTHSKNNLPDYSDDAGMGGKDLDYEALSRGYEEKCGKDSLDKFRACVKESIDHANEDEGYVAFPLGIAHPMYKLVTYECVKQIKEMGFDTGKIIVYVEHPYDYQNVGTGRIQKAKDYIQETLGLQLCRCDDLSVDQSVLKNIIQEVYGEEDYKKLNGSLERTFCSYFVNDKAVDTIKQFLKIHVNNVLFITAQAKPFLKTGGMGEVAYALCKTLKDFVNDVRIMMPKYSESMGFCSDAGSGEKESRKFCYWKTDDTIRSLSCEVTKRKYEGLVYYLLDMGKEFHTIDLDDRKNQGKFFAVFSDIMMRKGLKTIDYKPSILHCNDWQMALIPMLKKIKYDSDYPELKVIYTIHFYGYKGIFNKKNILEYVGLKKDKCGLCISCGSNCPFDRINFLSQEDIDRLGVKSDQMSFMKAGIEFADIITTVSKGYAKELQEYPDFSNVEVIGIRNGISQREYQFPESSGFCEVNCSNFLESKKQNKEKLQKKLGLETDPLIPLICTVSRLTADKGIEVIKEIIKEILDIPAQFVIIGDDDDDKITRPYKYFFDRVERKNKRRFAYRRFSEELEYEAYAGSDMFLMPSLKEACGTTQMNAMRYGVAPIVSRLDSFGDTVLDYEDWDKNAEFQYGDKGVGFYAYKDDCWVLLEVIKKAVEIYRQKDSSDEWNKIARNCMKADFGWRNKSIKEYLMLYNSAKE